MASQEFPLLVLQPALGPRHDWAGVRVLGADAAGAADLARLFGEFGLAAAVPGLACLLPPGALAQVDAAALPEGCTLRADDNAPPPPVPVQPPSKGPTKALLLKILGQITCDAETREIEATLKQDPQLSVQLLRLVNSAAFAPATRINSFAHAITLLGRRQLQRWLQLLMYASQSASDGNPLLAEAALRAALMEGLSKAIRGDRAMQDEAFMVGMFSRLDALFAQPLAEILRSLRLGEDVSAALLRRGGKLGELLALVEVCELGPPAVVARLHKAGIDNETWCRAQVDALRWTLAISREA